MEIESRKRDESLGRSTKIQLEESRKIPKLLPGRPNSSSKEPIVISLNLLGNFWYVWRKKAEKRSASSESRGS